jgi:hypothetical protein
MPNLTASSAGQIERMRKGSVSAIILVAVLIFGTSTSWATNGGDSIFYGPTIPAGGLWPECAYVSGASAPDAGGATFLASTKSRYSPSFSTVSCSTVLTRPNDWLGVGEIRLMRNGAPCSAATQQWFYNVNNTSVVSAGNVINGAPCGPGFYNYVFRACYGYDGGVHCSRTGSTGQWTTPQLYRT